MSTFSYLADASPGQAGVGSTLYGILYFVFMSAIILGAAYFATRFIAGKGFSASNNKNMKVVESISLGIDKTLLLVKVGEQYLLLGSTQKNISLLTTIEQEKLNLTSAAEVYNNLDGESFEAYIGKMGSSEEQVGMNSVKRNLNKLKSIVRGNKLDG